MGTNPIPLDDRPRKVLRGRKLKGLDTGTASLLAVGSWEHKKIEIDKPTQKQACAVFDVSMFPFSIMRRATKAERKAFVVRDMSFAELQKLVLGRRNGNGHNGHAVNGINKKLDEQAVFALLDEIKQVGLAEVVLAWLDRLTKPTK